MKKVERIIYSVLFAIISVWCISALLTPLLMGIGAKSLAMGFWNILDFGCHHKPERSFYIFGWQMGLCIRCTAIYFSIWLGTIIYPIIKKKSLPIWVLFVLIAPMSIDVFTDQYLYLRESANITRFITGSLFGISLPYFIISGITAIFGYINKKIIKIMKGVNYAEVS